MSVRALNINNYVNINVSTVKGMIIIAIYVHNNINVRKHV